MALMSAEEVAREMVTAPVMEHGWLRVRLEDAEDYIPLEPQESEYEAQRISEDVIGILTRLIERSRAEGAEAERERICAAIARNLPSMGMESPRTALTVPLISTLPTTMPCPSCGAHDPRSVAHYLGCERIAEDVTRMHAEGNSGEVTIRVQSGDAPLIVGESILRPIGATPDTDRT